MKVEKAELAEWEKLKSHGDLTEMAERFGINRVTLHGHFGSDDVPEGVYTAFKTFYEERKARLQKITAQ